jgi:hypothetical protein
MAAVEIVGDVLFAAPFMHEGVIDSSNNGDFFGWARCEDHAVGLDALGMPISRFSWQTGAGPVDMPTFRDDTRRWYLEAIDIFGPDRCMFESNAPADAVSVSYRDLWDAFKSMVMDFSVAEHDQLFRGVCSSVYGIDEDYRIISRLPNI